MSACRNCTHFSGMGSFTDNRVPKIETREDEEWYAPLRCRTTPVQRSVFDPVNDTMEVWKGYALVREVNTTYGQECPKFEPRAEAGIGEIDPDIKPQF